THFVSRPRKDTGRASGAQEHVSTSNAVERCRRSENKKSLANQHGEGSFLSRIGSDPFSWPRRPRQPEYQGILSTACCGPGAAACEPLSLRSVELVHA